LFQLETVTKTFSVKRCIPSDEEEADGTVSKWSKTDGVAVHRRLAIFHLQYVHISWMECRRSERLAKKGIAHYEEPFISDDDDYLREYNTINTVK